MFEIRTTYSAFCDDCGMWGRDHEGTKQIDIIIKLEKKGWMCTNKRLLCPQCAEPEVQKREWIASRPDTALALHEGGMTLSEIGKTLGRLDDPNKPLSQSRAGQLVKYAKHKRFWETNHAR